MEETLEDHEEVTEPGVEMGEGHERPKKDGGWGKRCETEAASQDLTLHPEDVGPSSGPRRVTGCAFVEAAVTQLGLGQMQGA